MMQLGAPENMESLCGLPDHKQVEDDVRDLEVMLSRDGPESVGQRGSMA